MTQEEVDEIIEATVENLLRKGAKTADVLASLSTTNAILFANVLTDKARANIKKTADGYGEMQKKIFIGAAKIKRPTT